jgi:hypothetical protein
MTQTGGQCSRSWVTGLIGRAPERRSGARHPDLLALMAQGVRIETAA